jgi:hypothetical protein
MRIYSGLLRKSYHDFLFNKTRAVLLKANLPLNTIYITSEAFTEAFSSKRLLIQQNRQGGQLKEFASGMPVLTINLSGIAAEYMLPILR